MHQCPQSVPLASSDAADQTACAPSNATPNRRAVLTSGAALAAGLAPTISGTASALGAAEPSPIGKLFQKWQAKVREVERLSAEWHEACRRSDELAPKVPPEMRVRSGLDYVDLRRSWFRPGGDAGEFTWMPTEGWREMIAEPECDSTGEPIVRLIDRAKAVLPIAERFDALTQEADDLVGYGTTGAAYDAVLDELWDLDTRILALPARSPGDLVAQAAIIRRQEAQGGAPEGMLTALLASIDALGGRGPNSTGGGAGV